MREREERTEERKSGRVECVDEEEEHTRGGVQAQMPRIDELFTLTYQS